MNSGMVPVHLIAGARTGFLQTIASPQELWRQIAVMVPVGEKLTNLVDLGGAPMPKKNKTGVTVQSMVERALRAEPEDWDITIHVTYNAVADDVTGTLLSKAKMAGSNFGKHMNQLVFQALNGGDATTLFGAGYDGLSFFSASHIDKGGAYQTAQSNVNTLTLTPDNFETVYVAASTRLDDHGEQTGYVPNLLVVPPANERAAAQITGNREMSGTSNRDINPWYGKVTHIVSPYLDTTSWYLVASNESIKPVLLIMRQMPFLQDAWFDREKPDGGWYCFKYYARYNCVYGDWRLASQGNT